MRTIRIYQDGKYQVGDKLFLTEEAGHHVGVVLRMHVGERFILFDGNNHEYRVEINEVHKKKVMVSVLDDQAVNRESSLIIHLAQAISKGERMELVVQKAVELGVASIIPLITERLALKQQEERWEKKQRQWQAIAIAACEQCGRNQIPTVNYPLSLSLFLQQQQQGQINFVLDPTSSKHWRDYQRPAGPISLLVGPEGGFSEPEIEQIVAAPSLPLNLGPRILRTETAAIAGISILQALWGDL